MISSAMVPFVADWFAPVTFKGLWGAGSRASLGHLHFSRPRINPNCSLVVLHSCIQSTCPETEVVWIWHVWSG